MDLFKLDPGLILWTWITFGVLLVLLGKFVFPGLFDSIDAREKKIREAVDNADRVEQRLADIEREHTEILRRSREEGDEILRRTRAEAEELRRKLLEQADAEVQELHARAVARIDEERTQAVEAIRAEIAELVCATSEQVIGRSFTSEDDRAWVRELVKNL